MKTYILPNTNNKARIIITPAGEYLQSYETIVLFVSAKTGMRYRTWTGQSNTTSRHIKTYCGLSQAEYNALPYKNIQQ